MRATESARSENARNLSRFFNESGYINGDHRLIGRLEGYRLLVDMLELAVTVGMMAAFLGLAVDLPTVFQLDQQLGDAAGADLVPHRAQSCRKLGVALRHPQQ